MADFYADRVAEGSDTTGLGALTLTNIAPSGYRTIAGAGGVSTNTLVFLTRLGNVWEITRGTFTSPATLTRDVLLSSSTGAFIDWGAGIKTVTNIFSASTAMDVSSRPRKNYLINGNFDIWQRGTSQTSSGYGSDDRWTNTHVGSTKTHSRQMFTLGQTSVPGEPSYFSRTVVTSVAGAANYVIKTQRIESVKTLAGQTATITFYAKADAAKNIAVEVAQLFGTGGSPSAEVSGIGVTKLALTTSWQKFSITAAIPSIAGKTLGTNNNDVLVLVFWLDAGTDFNTRTDTLGQQSGTFDIAQVQVEKGSVATEFEVRSPTFEAALAFRYYETVGIYLRLDSFGTYGGAEGTFTTTKRAAPSVVIITDTSVLSTAPSLQLASTRGVSYAALFLASGTSYMRLVVGADAEI